MASSAYKLWLKKREFKAPRAPPSPATRATEVSSLGLFKKTAESDSRRAQDAPGPSKTSPAKFHAVSAVETTHVAVKSVARPSAVRKRPRFWLSGPEGAAGGVEDQDRTVAGRGKVAGRQDGAKVAGWKRLRSGKEDVMKSTTFKLASAANILRQSSAKRDVERSVWSGRIDAETKTASVRTGEDSEATRIKSSSRQLEQVGKRTVNENESGVRTTKQIRFEAATKGGETGGEDRPKSLLRQKEPATRKRALEETVSGDYTTKRLRFDADGDEQDTFLVGSDRISGLPPKSPRQKKQKKMRTAMLDESQYWMAVDRFSHLS